MSSSRKRPSRASDIEEPSTHTSEWNEQRLKRLVESDPATITAAALRDSKVAEAHAFALALAKSLDAAKQSTETAINIKIIAQDGNETFFKVKPSTRLEKLVRAWAQRNGTYIEKSKSVTHITQRHTLRFLFDGSRILEPGSETPEECGMEDGDEILVMAEQMGGCVASPVPALFAHPATASPGLAFLTGEVAPADAATHDVHRLIEEVGGSFDEAPLSMELPLLDARSCDTLARVLDEAAGDDAPDDLRLTLSIADLERHVGAAAVKALGAAFCGLPGEFCPFDTVRLRRVARTPGPIPFHVDYAKRTMHVALDDEGAFTGGQPIFATWGGLVAPRRPRGGALIHRNCTVHGVTVLTAGVRHSLFLCDTTGADSLQALEYLVEPALAQLAFCAEALRLLGRTTDAQLSAVAQQYAQALRTAAAAAWTASPGMRAACDCLGMPGASGNLLFELAWRTHMLHPADYRKACAAADTSHGHRSLVEHVPGGVDEYGEPDASAAAPDGGEYSGSAEDLIAWLGLDLVAAMRRQADGMRALLAARGSCESRTAARTALAEYHSFLGRVKHSPTPLVPTVAVDWIWHTHMLHPQRYATECRRVAGSFVDHDDDVEPVEQVTGGF